MFSTLIVVSLVSFVVGVITSAVWPRRVVTADYASIRAETARLEKIFTQGVTGLHLKVDEVLAAAKSKV
jgi:hypothetical protein